MNKKHYPKNWPSIREQILARDQYACQQCGAKQYAVGRYLPNGKYQSIGEQVPLVQPNTKRTRSYRRALQIARRHRRLFGQPCQVIVLAVAHLDQDTTNNAVDNLRTFCQRCHFAYDRMYNIPKLLAARKYGKHRGKNQLEITFSSPSKKKSFTKYQ